MPNLLLWTTGGLLPVWSTEPPQPRSTTIELRSTVAPAQNQTALHLNYEARRNRPHRESQSRLVFKLPSREAPGNRQGGGSRDQGCILSQPTLTALMPHTNFGYTTSASPTFYWYIPPTKASTAEFVLQKKGESEVYRTILALDKTEGIAELSLSQTGTQLEIGQEYTWLLSLQCDVEDPSGNLLVQGSIQKIALTPAQQQELAGISQEERHLWYAQAGIWYDAVESLVQLRHSLPTPPSSEALSSQLLLQDWQDLLHSVTLDTLVSKPLLPCCSAMLAHP